jgi:hypothetical protein
VDSDTLIWYEAASIMEISGSAARMVAVAFEQLQRAPVVAEYNRRPTTEKAEFMMAYAAYVMWLIMVSTSNTQEPKEVHDVVTAIHEAFRKCDWYRPGLFERVWDSMQDILPRMQGGRYTGILIPLVHVIEAANRAGCKLQHTNDLKVTMDSVLIMTDILSAVAETPRKKWWQFWR